MKKNKIDSKLIIEKVIKKFKYKSCCRYLYDSVGKKFCLSFNIKFPYNEIPREKTVYFRCNELSRSSIFVYSKYILTKEDFECICDLINKNKLSLAKKLYNIHIEQYWIEPLE